MWQKLLDSVSEIYPQEESVCVCVSLSVMSNSVAHQVPLSMRFTRKELEWIAIPYSRESS